MLLFVRRFPLTPRVIFNQEFLIRFSCCFSLVWSLSYRPHALFILEDFFYTLMLLLVKSFSYKPHAMFIPDEFLLDIMGHLFEWGVSLTSLSYTLRSGFCEEFLLHSSSWFEWGVSPTLVEMVLVRSFSYRLLMLFLFERSFSYTPRVICFIEEFVLHSSSWF